MTTTRDRIQSLVQRGAVPPEEAEALLVAVGARGRPRSGLVLLDPLECFGAVQLTLVGLGVALLGIVLERFGMAFDGFLDMHRTSRAAGPRRELLSEARDDAGLLLIEGMSHPLQAASLDIAEQQRAYSDPSLPVVPELIERVATLAKP